MIPRLPDWSVDLLPGGFAFVHPEGADVARLLYRERMVPVRRVEVLTRTILAGWPALAFDVPGQIERLITDDGEHAAVVTVMAREHDVRVLCVLGFVVTDDFYSVVTATSRTPERFEAVVELVHDLVRRTDHGLGVRRRRFEYAPPPAFQPRQHSLLTEWLSPGYPADTTSIFVHPANPHRSEPLAELVDALALESSRSFDSPVIVSATEHAAGELSGIGRVVRLGGLTRWLVVLRDALYDYPIELVTPAPELLQSTFTSVVASIRPLPMPKVSARAISIDHF